VLRYVCISTATGPCCLMTDHRLSIFTAHASLMITDELIRQMTINCAERGLLLLRVRDELRMSIASYQTLYESSIAFGMRKALTAEQHKADMEAKVWRLSTRLSCDRMMWRDVNLPRWLWCVFTARDDRCGRWNKRCKTWNKQLARPSSAGS